MMRACTLHVYRFTGTLLVAMRLWGVDTTGNIVGLVTEPSGAIVRAAAIEVLNIDTGEVRKASTNDHGDYAVPALLPGVYDVSVGAPAFRTVVFRSVRVNVDETVRLDAQLEPGDVTFRVDVSEYYASLQKDTSELGQVVDRRKAANLPLNERNFLNFTLLVPGAQMPADGSQNSTQGAGGAVSVNGAREQSNNFLLDGIDNNDLSSNQYSAQPSMEAIEEFKVQSSNSSAEFGRTGGAQINIVLRSGTNAFHGSLFEYFRNRHLDAKNFFDLPDCSANSIPGTCAPIPKYNRNQFGGSLGGPIRKNGTFFFGAYEGLRARQAVTRQATVPSRIEREAVLAAVPSSERDPAGLSLFNTLPLSNTGTDSLRSNSFVASPVGRNDGDQMTLRLDHQLSSENIISGHYVFSDADRFDPYAVLGTFTNLPGFGNNRHTRGHSVRGAWTHIASPSLINVARFGFNSRLNTLIHQSVGQAPPAGMPDLAAQPRSRGFPDISIPGYAGLGESLFVPQSTIGDTYNYIDNLFWVTGRHQIKIGADIRRYNLDFFLDAFSRGNWWFFGPASPLESLVRGIPAFVFTASGSTDSIIGTTSWNFYGQDDIRVTPNFTINAGLRYEYNSPPVEQQDRLSIPDFSPASATCNPQPDCQFLVAGTNGIPRATFRADRNNFAPRFGFAWRPYGSRDYVIRGAYGIFYDIAILNRSIAAKINPPFFRLGTLANRGSDTIGTIADQPPSLQAAQTGLTDASGKDAYFQHWNLNVQRQLGTGLVIDAAVVGSKGTGLFRVVDPNQPLPNGGPRPYPQFGTVRMIAGAASSIYHAFQLRATQQYARGMTYLAAYTWSKAIDNASGMFGTTVGESDLPQDSRNLDGERGLSNFHAAHRLVVSYLQRLPSRILGDWELGLIWTAQSGRPFTVNREVDQSGTGAGGPNPTDRPDVVADPFLPGAIANHPDPACRQTTAQGGRAAVTVRTPGSWFNPCAFAAPATPRFGTVGRNTLIGPGFYNLDFSVKKEIAIVPEKQTLQLRVEFFNLFNHPNFDLPNRMFDSFSFSMLQSADAYGNKPPRQIQLGVRYIF